MLRLDPRASLLVVVDVQEKLAPAMPPAALEQLHRAARILLEAARLTGARIAATEQYPAGLGPTVAPLRDALASSGVEPIAKVSFSALGEPAFVEALFARRPRHVVVVGMEAHICVAQTVRDLCNMGFDVHVPLDGVASRRDDHKSAGLGLSERAGAAIPTAESVAFDWLGEARSDAWKAVSKLVR